MAYVEKINPCCRRKIFRKIRKRQDEKRSLFVFRKVQEISKAVKNG